MLVTNVWRNLVHWNSELKAALILHLTYRGRTPPETGAWMEGVGLAELMQQSRCGGPGEGSGAVVQGGGLRVGHPLRGWPPPLGCTHVLQQLQQQLPLHAQRCWGDLAWAYQHLQERMGNEYPSQTSCTHVVMTDMLRVTAPTMPERLLQGVA